MNKLERLQKVGWQVSPVSTDAPLPAFFTDRYPWLPQECLDFIASCESVVSPDEKSWFIACGELSEESESAFAWNAWELLMLETAEGDEAWQAEISAFWDEHCPMLLSVKDSCYSHVSIRKSDLAIVAGEEPEFEEVEKIAESFDAFVDTVADPDAEPTRYW